VELKASFLSHVRWAPFSWCTSDSGGVESIIFVPHPMSTIFFVRIRLGWNWKHHFPPTPDEHCFLRAHRTWVKLKASFSSHVRWAPSSSCTSDVGGIESIIFVPHPMSTIFFVRIRLGWIWKHHFPPTSDVHCSLPAHRKWVELKASRLSHVWWEAFSLCSSELSGIESIIFVPHPMSTIFFVLIRTGWTLTLLTKR
jgi:hypothetical protein